ncbi:MAG: hypothetical protein IIA70_04940 [Proteobacteria bacterium]|nr:hypothetical protein [Pseudomonadota bacterium]
MVFFLTKLLRNMTAIPAVCDEIELFAGKSCTGTFIIGMEPSHMRKLNVIVRRLVAFLLFATGFAVPAHGFLLQPQPRVCTEVFNNEPVVFVGKVTDKRVRLSDDGEFWEAYIYRLDVQEVFVGQLNGKVEVITQNDSARRNLDVGESYLLFAWEIDGALHIFGGGNSSKLSKAEETIHEIKRVLSSRKTATTGSIRGHVYIAPFNIPEGYEQGPGGITFVAKSATGQFLGVTDEGGWFQIEVPPGEYRVFPEPPQPYLKARDISYNDPEHVIINKGTCAEVGFFG